MSNQFTICEHGLRQHKCETCQFRDERDEALARIAELEAENKLLTETGQLYVLADIREIVDPMSPGRMMQKELIERIREIVGENARLAAIEANAINLCNHWAKSRRWPSDLSPFLSDLNAALAAKERT